MIKKLHIERIKLDFDNSNSTTINYQDIIDSILLNIMAQNQTMDVFQVKEFTTITENYYIVAFKMREKRGRFA